MKPEPINSHRVEPHASARPQSESPGASPSQEAIQGYARLLREQFAGLHLRSTLLGTALTEVPLEAFDQYINQYIEDATGSSCRKSPILRTMLEHLLLLSSTIARLHSGAFETSTVENRRTSLQTAASLTGELRRLSQAVESQIQAHRSATFALPRPEERKRGAEKQTG
jgi:hypothetical protein